jgi:hypothetical protein
MFAFVEHSKTITSPATDHSAAIHNCVCQVCQPQLHRHIVVPRSGGVVVARLRFAPRFNHGPAHWLRQATAGGTGRVSNEEHHRRNSTQRQGFRHYKKGAATNVLDARLGYTEATMISVSR